MPLLPLLSVSALVSSLALFQAAGRASSPDAEKAHARALSLLAAGDAEGAEAAAREALTASALFAPEREIAVAPEKNLLLEEVLNRARESYRARRARYFETLGLALARQGSFVASRKALRRAVLLAPSAGLFQAMALQPDLAVGERIALLVSAFFAPRADRSTLVQALLDTGAFRRPDTLQALLDRARFIRDSRPHSVPLELRVSEPPRFRVATDFGTLVTAESLAAGATLIFYFPAPGCARCSEELEGIGRAVSEATKKGKTVEAVVLVDESELAAARRVVRLLALRVQVGRADRLPPGERPEARKIRLVGRGGHLSAWLSLEAEPRSAEIRQALGTTFELLSHQDVPPEATGADRALSEIQEAGREKNALLALLDAAGKLEAGPLPLSDVSDRLDRLTGSLIQSPLSRDELSELLSRFAPLAGAGRAKARILNALDQDYPRKIFEAARGVEKAVTREAAREDGAYRVAVGPLEGRRAFLLQRSFVADDGLRAFNFVLREEGEKGLAVAWAGEEGESPRGTEAIRQGAVFHFERTDGVRGLRLIASGAVRYEGAPACLLGGEVVEEAPALVDPVAADLLPTYFRRGEIEGGNLLAREAALERGLQAFRAGNYRGAAGFFEQAAASIDAESLYDEVDLRYTRARAHEELGETKKALDLFSSIGDAPYQELVDEKILALETAGRRE
jgi:hypothetical protein